MSVEKVLPGDGGYYATAYVDAEYMVLWLPNDRSKPGLWITAAATLSLAQWIAKRLQLGDPSGIDGHEEMIRQASEMLAE